MPSKAKDKVERDMADINISRETFDIADKDTSRFKAKEGISREIVEQISASKNEPQWMRDIRLKAFELFEKTPLPKWGPNLDKLDLTKIVYFIQPGTQQKKKWEDLPPEIRKTFDRLGIPEAEKKSLSGVGAQYDSEIVYHNLKEEWKKKGVIFENMDDAVQKYPDLVRKYFMNKCIPINDHKFIMLHAAVWSGGTFIYVPKGVKVDIPLQAYFRMNSERGGQFEHTLIIADEGAFVHYIEGCSAPVYTDSSLHAGCVELFVHKNATIKYSSVENWSKNTFNLNTKRAIVHEEGTVAWVNGNMGSGVTYLYPSSVLVGKGARSDSLGIVFAGKGQNQDTGSKVVHAAPYTTSTIRSKSISRDGGISSYRGLVRIAKGAKHSKASVGCDALLIDQDSVSNTYPFMKVEEKDVSVVHEATVGKISKEQVYYLMTRGLSEEQAMRMIVSGFIEPIIKQLPLEYAVELNKLIELEMEGAVG